MRDNNTFSEGDEQTDSDCPWCGSPLYQGAEVRYCGSCPFNAQYPADLAEAPPYIIKAFATRRYEQWQRNPEDSEDTDFEVGETYPYDELAERLEYWGGDEKVLVLPGSEREVYFDYATIEVVDIQEMTDEML